MNNTPLKALFFLMEPTAAFSPIYPAALALAEEGWEVTVAQYSCDKTGLPPEIDHRVRHLTISDLGLSSIPPLTIDRYQRLCGDDVDFDACLLHHFAMKPAPDHQILYNRSYFRDQLRGAAYRIEQILKIAKPDRVVIQNGSETTSKIIYAKSIKLGIPCLLAESAFFPDHFLIDPVGSHFFPGINQIDLDWPTVKSRPLSADEHIRTIEAMNEWRRSKISKHPQPSSVILYSNELQAINKAKKRGKILFIPGQTAGDSSLINSRSNFSTSSDLLLHASENLPEGWMIVYKPHPYDKVSSNIQRNNIIPINANVHDIFASSSAVLTISSNVGLEALVYGLPVICSGRPHYSRKGFTFDLEASDSLHEALGKSADYSPDTEAITRYLHYILFAYLIHKNDTGLLSQRIKSAHSSGFLTHPRAPFNESYPKIAYDYVRASEVYSENFQSDRASQTVEIDNQRYEVVPTTPSSPQINFARQHYDNLESLMNNRFHSAVEWVADFKRKAFNIR